MGSFAYIVTAVLNLCHDNSRKLVTAFFNQKHGFDSQKQRGPPKCTHKTTILQNHTCDSWSDKLISYQMNLVSVIHQCFFCTCCLISNHMVPWLMIYLVGKPWNLRWFCRVTICSARSWSILFAYLLLLLHMVCAYISSWCFFYQSLFYVC